jgi:hypothetical protein
MSEWKPGTGVEKLWIEGQDRESLHRIARVTGTSGARNGLPESAPYVWNVAGRARELEVEAQLKAIRARLSVPENGDEFHGIDGQGMANNATEWS